MLRNVAAMTSEERAVLERFMGGRITETDLDYHLLRGRETRVSRAIVFARRRPHPDFPLREIVRLELKYA